jgi:ribosomal protein S18 acetylase RimI-like enzyme
MSNIEIKIATIDDVEDILEINQMTGELHEANLPNYFKHSTEQSQKTFLESTINSEWSEVFIAKNKQETIGYLVLFLQDHPKESFMYDEFGYIGSLGVKEEYQRQGIATLLIQKAEEYLINRGIYAMDLDVFMFNDKAFNLYQKLGYEEIKRNLRKILK